MITKNDSTSIPKSAILEINFRISMKAQRYKKPKMEEQIDTRLWGLVMCTDILFQLTTHNKEMKSRGFSTIIGQVCTNSISKKHE